MIAYTVVHIERWQGDLAGHTSRHHRYGGQSFVDTLPVLAPVPVPVTVLG
jgi:hypothetical protein